MALQFHPNPGTILMCDFNGGFKTPEMVKRRPVIVVSPKMKNCTGLVTVVPVSTRMPEPVESYHYKIPNQSLPQTNYFQRAESWVKCDMIYRVGFDRLNLIHIGKDRATGKRLYYKNVLGRGQMNSIRAGMLHSLQMGHLAEHL
ncbi:type II toxin-antitoxin system PemK/MazF family toxin [Photobacterium sp. DA100]|uniref:type II toxin-antitoxin system PemK/MazF family toxin n=1 Tax=Photobacterium sp. DA100 TaxID=3027472 RepID=UPI002478B98C|nr:type II toxin-antitoxin system PemK/MazF family toxin [Photobacterium sp. DA100]WEM42246.1 type II toxin-antitoxin system PemK/MazF family toxin [Photobacterium sp. DA100]